MAHPLSNEDADLEAWQNATQGRVVILRLAATGELRHEMINGGRQFHLTPRERRVNQEKAANRDLDVFLNGTLQPIRLIDDNPESQAVKGNPNHVGEKEVKALFRMHHTQFDARLQAINNASTLEHLLEMAKEDETRATVRQMEKIQERINQVNTPVDMVSTSASSERQPSDAPSLKGITPR